jgi:hypothetical protein
LIDAIVLLTALDMSVAAELFLWSKNAILFEQGVDVRLRIGQCIPPGYLLGECDLIETR